MNGEQLCLKTSRRGNPIVEIKGRNLHSQYDPVREADRFVDGSCKDVVPGTIVLLGAETGYITAAVRQKYPRVKLICIFYSQAVYDLADRADKAGWHPGAGISLLDYLRDQLDELDLKGLKVLEWPASAAIFPAMAREANHQLSHILKELSGSFFTSYAAGKLWIKNSFYNFTGMENFFSLEFPGTHKPVVIAGSGPSLAEGREAIRAERDNICLWALPSAVLYLQAADIIPDFIVLTDPGYYSIYHLQTLKGTSPRILMPLSAAAGVWQLEAVVAFFAQPSFFESALLKFFGKPFPAVPALGTVAATALELAFLYTDNLVITSGLDFCYRDIQSHVLPSPFDRYFEAASARTNPTCSQLYRNTRAAAPFRTGEQQSRTSRALLTYAGWFNHLPGAKKRRMRKLQGSFHSCLQVDAVSAGGFSRLVRDRQDSAFFSSAGEYRAGQGRREYCLKLLDAWKDCAARERERVRRQRYAAENFFSNKLLFDLAYFIDLDLLNKASYLARSDAGTELYSMLDDLLGAVCGFLEILQKKIGSRR